MAEVIIDPDFAAAILRSADVRDMVKTAADEVGDRAKTETTSESIAKGIEVEVGLQDGAWTGRINAKDFKSGWFEHGTVKMRARPFLRKAAMALGYKIEAGRRV